MSEQFPPQVADLYLAHPTRVHNLNANVCSSDAHSIILELIAALGMPLPRSAKTLNSLKLGLSDHQVFSTLLKQLNSSTISTIVLRGLIPT
jgi:hypothetical protein